MEHGQGRSQCVDLVDSCVNAFEGEEVLFHPFTDDMIFDVHVSSARSGILCHSHGCASVIILVEERCRVLRNI